MTRISDAERRARLVERHHLGRTAGRVGDAVEALVALHSSDPLTPYLSLRARVAGFVREDLDRALFEDRQLVRLHAMRRTLFVVRADDVPVFQGAVGLDFARRERRRLENWIRAEGREEVEGWLAELEGRVLEALDGSEGLLTGELSERVPELEMKITLGSGKWTARSPVSSRLLFLMAMEGRVVRTRPAGRWRSSQYRWAVLSRWLRKDDGSEIREAEAEPPSAVAPEEARAGLLRRYLRRFGPAGLDDVRWWTGWTVTRARAALEDVGAVGVDLESGGEAYVLPGDEAGEAETAEPAAGAVAFLPALDPSIMGWKDRDWFLGPHAELLFDRNGNAGPTILVGGRVVGGWGLSSDAGVAYRLLEQVGAEAEAQVAEEAAALSDWLAGESITPRFRTPLEKELRGD